MQSTLEAPPASRPESGSPSRRWDKSRFNIPDSPKTPASSGLSLEGRRDEKEEQRFLKDHLTSLRDNVRFVRQEVMEARGVTTTLEFRFGKLLEGFDELRATTEQRLDQLATTLGASPWGLDPASPSASPAHRRDSTPEGGTGQAVNRLDARLDLPLRGASPSGAGGGRNSIPLFERLRRVERALGDTTIRESGTPRRGAKGAEGERAPREVTLLQRVNFMERALGDSVEKRARDEAEAKAGRSPLLMNMSFASPAPGAAVVERLTYVEGVVGDSVDKHAREIAAAHVKLDLFSVRVGHCEVAKDHIHTLRKSHDKHAADLQAHHATFRQRLDYLETLIGDSADKHAMELARLRADRVTNAAHVQVLTDCKRKMDDIEQAHSERSQQHMQELEKVQATHAKLMGDVSATLESHVALRRDVDASHASLKQDIDSQAAQHATHVENHAAMREEIQKAGAALDSHTCSIQERVHALEQKLAELLS